MPGVIVLVHSVGHHDGALMSLRGGAVDQKFAHGAVGRRAGSSCGREIGSGRQRRDGRRGRGRRRRRRRRRSGRGQTLLVVGVVEMLTLELDEMTFVGLFLHVTRYDLLEFVVDAAKGLLIVGGGRDDGGVVGVMVLAE